MTERPTLQHRLNTARLTRFVGREPEIVQFRAALDEPEIAILYLHGPGGVGKSSLLDVFAHHAEAEGLQVARIDARDIDSTPAGLLLAFDPTGRSEGPPCPPPVVPTEAEGPLFECSEGPPCPPGERVLTAASPERVQLVVMLDTWELAAPMDPWLRDVFLPSLPASALVVISSRTPPGPEWTAHRSWAPLLRVIGLRNFRPEESESFLRNQGIASERQPDLAELSYGHPLALALLCALERQAGETAGSLAYRDHPDLVRALLERCLHTLPRGEERLALAICAHSRVTTEELLREVMELDDAGPIFDWLRGLSIMQEGPYGIFPHDLARDVIDADFRWRDLHRYVDMHTRVRAPVLRRIRGLHGLEQQQAATDLLYLHRNGPVMGKMHDWDSLGHGRAEPATPDALPVILEMVERFEGAESATIARYWWERMPSAFTVFRGAGDEIFGFNAGLFLTEPDAESIAADPAMATMWRVIDAHGPLRPGEVAVHERFGMDRTAHQAPSPGFNMMAMCCLLNWSTTPNLAWSFLAHSHPELWERVFVYLDQLPFPEAAFQVGGRRYAVYCHDWRTVPADVWLEKMGEREIASEPPPRTMATELGVAQVLSRPDFEQAVRRALRDLHDSPALSRNPLSRSRLVVGSILAGQDAASTLHDRLITAIQTLESSPRDIKLSRAIHHTFVQPAGSQELAAEALDLPFNTYRYHLSGGIRRIVDDLWRIELGAS